MGGSKSIAAALARQRRSMARGSGEEGSALSIALVFMVVFSILLTALFGFTASNAMTARNLRVHRDEQYAADSAMEAAVAWVAATRNVGRDPQFFPFDPPCTYTEPAVGNAPAVTVVCSAEPGEGSGVQEEQGIVPDAAITTLGQRHQEPGEYNLNATGSVLGPLSIGELCPSYAENGLLVRQNRSCTSLNGPATEGSWSVVGDVVSNSTIGVGAGRLTALTRPGQGASRIIARAGCTGQFTPAAQCNQGTGSTDPAFNDPGYAHRPFTTDGKTGGPALQVASVGAPSGTAPRIPTACVGAPTNLTKLYPGIYTSAKQLNDLINSNSCKGKTIWLTPGVYYFNFSNNDLSAQCGRSISFATQHEPADNKHLLCIGTAENTNVRVVGGTPYGEWKGERSPTNADGFPRVISPTDPYGGDCDPTKPGVQMIFGGDSRLYVADGSLEVCAGPDPNRPSDRPQIPLYGIPALPEMVAGQATGNGNGSGWSIENADNGRIIGEPSGRVSARLRYEGTCSGDGPQSVDCILGFGGGTIESQPLLLDDFGTFSVPAGLRITDVKLRVAYDSNAIIDGLGTSQRATIIRQDGTRCDFDLPATNENQQETVDVTSCFGATGNVVTSRLQNFDIEWKARGFALCGFGSCSEFNDTLDGMSVIITADPISLNAAVDNPGNRCIVAHPNYQDGIGAPDCPVFKTDQQSPRASIFGFPLFGNTIFAGRASFKGTVYAPSAVLDFADEDIRYPLFSRGIIGRHLRFKSLSSPTNTPIGDVQMSPQLQERDVTFTACTQAPGGSSQTNCDPVGDGDEIVGSAHVVFRVDTVPPCFNNNIYQRRARCPDVREWRIGD